MRQSGKAAAFGSTPVVCRHLVPPLGFSESHSVSSPFAGDGRSALVPRHVVDVGVSAYLAEVDGLLSQGSVETWGRKRRATLIHAVRTINEQII